MKLVDRVRICVILPLLLIASAACQSDQEVIDDFDPLDIHTAGRARSMTYVSGDWQPTDWPRPNYRPVYVIVKEKDIEKGRELAYHTWDFNHDGKADMVEALDSKGGVFMRLYDFNFDGQIDTDQRIVDGEVRRVIELIQ